MIHQCAICHAIEVLPGYWIAHARPVRNASHGYCQQHTREQLQHIRYLRGHGKGSGMSATHLTLVNARIDSEVVQSRRRTIRMERAKAVALAAAMLLVAGGIMSLVGWISAKYGMGY